MTPDKKMDEQKEKYKIIVMAILVGICCTFTYYFHAILEIGGVFSHFYYVPIILACLWWRRKGLVVAIFLATLIIFSHIFVREEVVTANDYLRALMFVAISVVVATLSEMISKARERIAHLNLVLHAIRNVNQLIAREKDRNRLLKGTCERLIATHGYHNAWIALLDEAGGLVTSEEAGLGEDFLPLVERLKRDELPDCCRRALTQSEVMVIEDPFSACTDCPLADNYGDRGAIVIGLEHGGKVYGLLSASVLVDFATHEEEQALFKEVAQDISFALHSIELEEEHKRTEEEVKKEKKFSDNIITTVSDSLIVLDKDLKIKNVNRTFYKAFQTEPEKVIGRSITNILGDGDGKLTFELTKLVGTEDMLENFEMLYKSEKQGERIFNVRARGILIAEEEEVIVLEDITERKRMEEAMRLFSEELELKVEERTKELKNERDYTRHLIGSSPDFQLTLDKEGNIMDVNEAFEHIVGRSREELIGSSIYEYLPKSTTEKAIVEILEKDKVRDIEIKADIPKKDSILNCSCTIFTISEGEVGIYATGRDTTELRTKEMQLIHAGRLASLGELATGVAHEINQPLTVISMAAGGRLLDIEKKCLDMNTLPQDLEDILGNVKRIDRIITHMRTFARKPEEWEHLEPEEVLSNVFILLGEQFKMQDIPVSRKIEANLPLIKADENQLEQVFVNILTNARQALDERGENAKEEGERFEKQMVCCISKERENGKGWVVFEFADNAFGVPPELKMRVFEPFFTTKEAGEGTGLGLSIAYSIVTQSLGGNIWVEDNDMGGASFKVALPVEGKEEKKEVAEEEVRDYI